MESAITICNHNSLAFSLSRNPNSSTKNSAKIASLASKLPNQLLNCSALSSASLTKKSQVSHVQQRSFGASVQCSAAGTTAATPSGSSFLHQFLTLNYDAFFIIICCYFRI